MHRDTHEAMIMEEEAETLLERRTRDAQTRRRYRHNTYLLSGLLRCGCGAALDGEGGYYRCHDRWGGRSIKQESIEQAVLKVLGEELLTPHALQTLKAEVEKASSETEQQRDGGRVRLQQELRTATREIDELVGLLSKVTHQRPLLERLDAMEARRTQIEQDLAPLQAPPALLTKWDEAEIRQFLEEYRENLDVGEADQKKALLRSLIDHAVLERDQLTVYPHYEQLTGVKMASPRGFEPLLPP